jgi:hypothetical protein
MEDHFGEQVASTPVLTGAIQEVNSECGKQGVVAEEDQAADLDKPSTLNITQPSRRMMLDSRMRLRQS